MSDPEIVLSGYQVHFVDLRAGLFLFTHERAGCHTTFSIEAGGFFDLYEGPIFEERMAGRPECPGHCLHPSRLERCPVRCECAFVREVIDIIKKWPKQPQERPRAWTGTS